MHVEPLAHAGEELRSLCDVYQPGEIHAIVFDRVVRHTGLGPFCCVWGGGEEEVELRGGHPAGKE